MPPLSRAPLSPLAAFSLLLLIPAAIHPQSATAQAALETFRPQFESTLKQHGTIGGGFALVRDQGPAQTIVFGEARADSHRKIDTATSYN
jgi:hypothetical protein